MANLRFRLTIVCVGLVLIALALGWFAPTLIEALREQVTPVHLLAATLVFVGLCGVAFYTLMERALNSVMRLIDTFTRMRAGDLNPRLPVEGPEEIRRMARGFNDMVEDLETQIREIEVEKQSAERDRQQSDDRLRDSERFRWAFDAAAVGVLIADHSLEIVYQNPASESRFLQLDVSDNLDQAIVGAPISALYPDASGAAAILSDHDRLPYETDVTFGPHRLHFLASAVFDEDEEFAGVVLIWGEVERLDLPEDEPEFSGAYVESLGEPFDYNEDLEPVDPNAGIDEDVLAEVEELEAEQPFEMIAAPEDEDFELVDVSDEDVMAEVEELESEQAFAIIEEPEEETPANQNGHLTEPVSSPEIERSARLVKRSVGMLADRLTAVTTAVGALVDEGDSLKRSIEEIKDQAERAGRFIDERSEPLHDLVDDRERTDQRRQTVAELIRTLKAGLSEAADLDQAVDRLRGSIEHLVISSKVELGRVEAGAGGLSVVVDAIGDLGEEARRLSEVTHRCIRDLTDRADAVLTLFEAEGDPEGYAQRIEARAERALARIEADRDETNQRNDLLTEMARGQAEIAQHLSKQISELSELVTLTAKVAAEQVDTVEGADRA